MLHTCVYPSPSKCLYKWLNLHHQIFSWRQGGWSRISYHQRLTICTHRSRRGVSLFILAADITDTFGLSVIKEPLLIKLASKYRFNTSKPEKWLTFCRRQILSNLSILHNNPQWNYPNGMLITTRVWYYSAIVKIYAQLSLVIRIWGTKLIAFLSQIWS